jgi:hypothetical protein
MHERMIRNITLSSQAVHQHRSSVVHVRTFGKDALAKSVHAAWMLVRLLLECLSQAVTCLGILNDARINRAERIRPAKFTGNTTELAYEACLKVMPHPTPGLMRNDNFTWVSSSKAFDGHIVYPARIVDGPRTYTGGVGESLLGLS